MQINISILTPSLLQLPLFSSHIRGTQAVYKHKPSKSDNMRMDLRTEKPIAPTEIKQESFLVRFFSSQVGKTSLPWHLISLEYV